jgi:transketolase
MLKRTADTLRVLAAEMVQQANSGHPGLPMGMADCAAVLWAKYMTYDPDDPNWPGRDRFVLSGGHGSALLYALLHLAGYDMPLDELKNFRQWDSQTPGHPECHTPGVETTTGPLGQGLANAVGMAIAARMSAEKWNTQSKALFGDHYTYCFCGDGDMMEGLSHEASSLAGHLGLGKLICFYDSNRITIDGSTDLSFSDNVAMRYASYHWHVLEIDGHDHEQIAEAIRNAQKENEKPSLIIAHTHIGYGSPNKQNSASAHGAPLGEEELRLTKKALGFPEEKSFFVPDEVKVVFTKYTAGLKEKHREWQKRFISWKEENKERYQEYEKQVNKTLPSDLDKEIMRNLSRKENATRAYSGHILQEIVKHIPGLMGGAADLAASNLTLLKDKGIIRKDDFSGKNLYYGVREFAMGAVMNGIALYGAGFIPYGGTFLVFSDYMRNAIRMSAIMKQQVIYVFTHDSIFVGEDGPTHQPVEQLMSLRLIPGLHVYRPADEVETAQAWLAALRRQDGPTALILTRQKCPDLHKNDHGDMSFEKGAYIIEDSSAKPEIIIAASGSELSISMEAARELRRDGKNVRVISVPSIEIFLAQNKAYRDNIIPPGDTPLICVEAGRTLGWGQLSRNPCLYIGMDDFGRSAPYPVLAEKFGFTADAVYKKIKAWLGSAELRN